MPLQDHLDPEEKANNRWSSDKGKGSFGNLRWATLSQQRKENRKEKEKEIESEKTPQHLMDGEIAWYCPRPHPLSIIVNKSSTERYRSLPLLLVQGCRAVVGGDGRG